MRNPRVVHPANVRQFALKDQSPKASDRGWTDLRCQMPFDNSIKNLSRGEKHKLTSTHEE